MLTTGKGSLVAAFNQDKMSIYLAKRKGELTWEKKVADMRKAKDVALLQQRIDKIALTFK